MRRLIYIPIIHGEIDMGSLSDKLKDEYIAKFGKSKWQEYLNVSDELWVEIRRRLERLKLNYKKVKLYQDGLPKSGKELNIAKELAEKGSPKGAIGLMQVMPHMAKELGFNEDLFSIDANIKLGTFILADNIRRWGYQKGIQRYFWGTGAADNRYLARVLKVLEEFKG